MPDSKDKFRFLDDNLDDLFNDMLDRRNFPDKNILALARGISDPYNRAQLFMRIAAMSRYSYETGKNGPIYFILIKETLSNAKSISDPKKKEHILSASLKG